MNPTAQSIVENNDLTVRNPLTESSLIVREVINELFSSGKLECLNALRERPFTPSELTNHVSVSRPTVDKYCNTFVDRGWIKRTDRLYSLTAAGAIVRREAKGSLAALTESDLTWLSGASVKPQILKVLSSEPMTPAALVEHIDDISRARVSQLQGKFDDRGWIDRTRSELRLTSAGVDAIEAYTRLLNEIEQVITNAPALRDLGPECEDLPVARLDDARLVVARPSRKPFATVNEYLKLAERDFSRLRGFSSFYDTRYARAFHPAIKAGKKMETISPEGALDDMPIDTREDVTYVVEGLAAENVSWLIYPGELPLGLAIFDTDLVVIGATNPGEASDDMAANIHSTDEEVIQWAVDLYNDYREASYTPPAERVASYLRLPTAVDVLRGVRMSVTDILDGTET